MTSSSEQGELHQVDEQGKNLKYISTSIYISTPCLQMPHSLYPKIILHTFIQCIVILFQMTSGLEKGGWKGQKTYVKLINIINTDATKIFYIVHTLNKITDNQSHVLFTPSIPAPILKETKKEKGRERLTLYT